MTETSETQTKVTNNRKNLGQTTFNRRQIFKLAGILPFALLLGNEALHEKTLSKTGEFETEDAVWRPIYERHDQHEQTLVPANIPQTLNALSIEGAPQSHKIKGSEITILNALQMSVDSLFTNFMFGQDTMTPSVNLSFPLKTIEFLKQTHIPIAFGDVRTDAGDYASKMSTKNALETREKIGELFLASGTATVAAGQILKSCKMDRRGFLRVSGQIAMAIGALKYIPARHRLDLHRKIMDSVENSDPMLRVWTRLNTISSAMMPEYLNDLFRELIQANKLITLARHIKSRSPVHKPYIGYNWHYSHRGIEDWLRIGQTVTRECILAFPNEVFRKIIKTNVDDSRANYALRLVQIPQSLEIISVDNSSITSRFNNNEVVADEIIKDQILEDRLKNRGLI